jgi:competence protein ComEC
MSGRQKTAFLIFIILCVADGAVWQRVLVHPPTAPVYQALDIGQGDSTVITLPGGAVIMTDAGPDDTVLSSFAKALPGAPRIDLAIISHPQLDHFNGYNFLIDHYSIGAFIINGRNDTPGVRPWLQLLDKIRARHIPLITLGAGDSIHYDVNTITILSPGQEFRQSAELNDTGLVEYVKTKDWTALLTGDTGTNIEDYLFGKKPLPVDILKVGHHGSKYSTGTHFLTMIQPKVATVSVGANNHYGHPTPETLQRLALAKISVFRTDQKGTVTIWKEAGKLRIETEK